MLYNHIRTFLWGVILQTSFAVSHLYGLYLDNFFLSCNIIQGFLLNILAIFFTSIINMLGMNLNNMVGLLKEYILSILSLLLLPRTRSASGVK